MFDSVQRALIIAPHPDDEVLGCGGTIARLAASGRHVHVAIVTTGRPPRVSQELVDRVRGEVARAHGVLQVRETHFLDFPAAELDGVPHADLNAAIDAVVSSVKPDLLLLPFLGDLHLDHQLAFVSGMVAARPRPSHFPRLVLAYETLSETNWFAPGITPTFSPNVYVDISDHLDTKLAAFSCFESQMRAFPNERSLEALQALATLRGATVNLPAAESFVLIRHVT
jgi:N-acetylglucosamine malate deacetylase 1